ncbi:hypothetical protein MPTK2_1g18370 [Marchantia polymorpha subsp. ruderalis]
MDSGVKHINVIELVKIDCKLNPVNALIMVACMDHDQRMEREVQGFVSRSHAWKNKYKTSVIILDNSEQNISLSQILAALQHLQQEKATLQESSPLLQDFDAFMEEFEAVFGYIDKARMQLTCNITWGGAASINQFCCGLCDDVQVLFLTLLDTSTLCEAITQDIQCDNRLFGRCQEKKIISNAQHHINHSIAPPLAQQALAVVRPASFGPISMHIDVTKFKPLIEAEQLCHGAHNLCLYCGNLELIARHCPLKFAKLQVI